MAAMAPGLLLAVEGKKGGTISSDQAKLIRFRISTPYVTFYSISISYVTTCYVCLTLAQ